MQRPSGQYLSLICINFALSFPVNKGLLQQDQAPSHSRIFIYQGMQKNLPEGVIR